MPGLNLDFHKPLPCEERGWRVDLAREDLLARIKPALGACVAEELIDGTITTDAESDLQRLTQIAAAVTSQAPSSSIWSSDGQWPASAGIARA